MTGAKSSGASQATVADLQTKADAITSQRNTLFKGETLRGLLLLDLRLVDDRHDRRDRRHRLLRRRRCGAGMVIAGFVHLRRSTKAQPAHAG